MVPEGSLSSQSAPAPAKTVGPGRGHVSLNPAWYSFGLSRPGDMEPCDVVREDSRNRVSPVLPIGDRLGEVTFPVKPPRVILTRIKRLNVLETVDRGVDVVPASASAVPRVRRRAIPVAEHDRFGRCGFAGQWRMRDRNRHRTGLWIGVVSGVQHPRDQVRVRLDISVVVHNVRALGVSGEPFYAHRQWAPSASFPNSVSQPVTVAVATKTAISAIINVTPAFLELI